MIDRIRKAVEVISGDAPEGTLREQAEALLGAQLDDECVETLNAMANSVGQSVFVAYVEKDVSPTTAITASRASILIAGMAVGKRLGAEEGEEFGRITALLEEP